MMANNTGIYTIEEFNDRGVIKLAPDAFVIVQGRSEARVIVSKNNKTTDVNFKTGIVTINSSTSAQPGAGTCNLTFVCPQYESLDTSYHIPQPNGTLKPFFTSMMEVVVYSKGRFLRKNENGVRAPSYYPTFWGYMNTIEESYNGSESTFNISCKDMLSWWAHMNVNITTSTHQQRYGGGAAQATGSVFRRMSPWEIILNLFKNTNYDNFIYPSLIYGDTLPPLFSDYVFNGKDNNIPGAYEKISRRVLDRWNSRYNFGKALSPDDQKNSGVSNLEMFGISKIINLSGDNSPVTLVKREDAALSRAKITNDLYNGKSSANQAYNGVIENNKEDKSNAPSNKPDPKGDSLYRFKSRNSLDKHVDPDLGILEKVLPFQNFDETSVQVEPKRMSKLEVASYVADSINFEFFQDTNGSFVFKPPFYNMDTSNNSVYVIDSGEILTFSEVENSDEIVTYLEVTGPILYQANTTEYAAVHIDFPLMERFGIRERSVKLWFGNNNKVLRAMAASEMTKINSKANTASLTIPYRPEIRIGYPIYIDHIDAYYYIKGVSHSLSFGSTATTSLILEAKREKVFDEEGNARKGYIYKAFDRAAGKDTSDAEREKKRESDSQVDNSYIKKNLEAVPQKNIADIESNQDKQKNKKETLFEMPYSLDMSPSDKYRRDNGVISSPDPGFYKIVQLDKFASIEASSSDALESTKALISKGGLTELFNFTDGTVPYTDVNGYRHIGGFPYGATLVLTEDQKIFDAQDPNEGSILARASEIQQITATQDSDNMPVLVGEDPRLSIPENRDPNESINTCPDPSSDALSRASLTQLNSKVKEAARNKQKPKTVSEQSNLSDDMDAMNAMHNINIEEA